MKSLEDLCGALHHQGLDTGKISPHLFLKERLAEFKRPKQIHVTTAIPRTATGKIQRGAVAKAYAPTAS